MEDYSGHIRGLINDLLRSLSAALIHLDDLMIKMDRDSDMFSDVCLIRVKVADNPRPYALSDAKKKERTDVQYPA